MEAHVVGIDEVGYGALAGPVVVCVLALPAGLSIQGIRDSKKLSPSKREELALQLHDYVLAFLSASAEEIDREGVHHALNRLHREAAEIGHQMFPNDEVILDGDIQVPHAVSVVKADNLYPAVMGASICAKVYRDTFMSHLDSVYPGYRFRKHKGYGTPEHYEALAQLGACPIHRSRYLRSAVLPLSMPT